LNTLQVKQRWGWAALYATNIAVLAVAILWTALLVREKERPTPTSDEKGENMKPCYHVQF
jgi:hypothetical protein